MSNAILYQSRDFDEAKIARRYAARRGDRYIINDVDAGSWTIRTRFVPRGGELPSAIADECDRLFNERWFPNQVRLP